MKQKNDENKNAVILNMNNRFIPVRLIVDLKVVAAILPFPWLV